MPTGNTCLKCGAPLEDDARQVFCPKCLFAQIAAGPASPGASGSDEVETETPTPPITPIDFPTGRRFGDYELLEELGRGGMGIVYRARQIGVRRQVAVKLLHFGQRASEETVKRLRMEATAAGCLRHPNIVAIHEVGIHEDQHFLAMDYVAGPNLSILASNQPWTAPRAARLVKTVADAIHHAHEHGILHRDLKPSNILVEADDQPRITDFGLAKRLAVRPDTGPEAAKSGETGTSNESAAWLDDFNSLTVTGQVLGSPNYMPPEQASAARGKVGRHSDVYSLGAVLYHLLTERPPFLGETITATLHQVLATEAASPRLLNPRVPVDLETICLRCLEKEPERRYATARELAEELGRFLKGEPILARPLSRLQRLWRWCCRNPVVASLTSATLLLLLTVAIGSPIAVLRIDRERKQVEQQSERANQERQRAVRSEAETRTQLYAANMNLAQQAWDENNIGRVRQLLDETETNPDRGFEWHYWRRQINQEQMILHSGAGVIQSVMFSPDGQSILACSGNATLHLWEVSSGHKRLTSDGGLATFSPDSKQLVFGNHGHAAVILDLNSSETIMKLIGHTAAVQGAVFSPDGLEIATWSDDKTIRIWDTGTGRERLKFQIKSGTISSLAYSPDGRAILTGERDRVARILDSRSGEELRIFQGHGDGIVYSAVFSPDGRFVLTGSEDHTARVWESSTGQVLHVLRGHTHEVRSAVFSPDGRQILTGSMDQTAKLWDSGTGRELRTFKGHEDWVMSAAFSPQGDLIATGAWNSEIKLWNLRTSESAIFPVHTRLAVHVDISRDGQRLLATSYDSAIKVWEMESQKELIRLKGHTGIVWSAVFSPDGQKVLSGSADGTAQLWEISSGRPLHIFRPNYGEVTCVAYSHNGKRIAIGSSQPGSPGIERIWDPESGKLLMELREHGLGLVAITFSPDDRLVATASADWTARLWDARTGHQLRILSGHGNWVRSVAFSPDGQRLVTASEDRTIKIWDVASGKELRTLKGHRDHVRSAEFSPTENRILSGSHDNTASLWDSMSGRLMLTLKGHSGRIYCATFSADGRRIATASADGTARLWEAETGPDEKASTSHSKTLSR